MISNIHFKEPKFLVTTLGSRKGVLLPIGQPGKMACLGVKSYFKDKLNWGTADILKT